MAALTYTQTEIDDVGLLVNITTSTTEGHWVVPADALAMTFSPNGANIAMRWEASGTPLKTLYDGVDWPCQQPNLARRTLYFTAASGTPILEVVVFYKTAQ